MDPEDEALVGPWLWHWPDLPVLFWPSYSEELRRYNTTALPPKPDDLTGRTLAYCFRDHVFWIQCYSLEDGVGWSYHGPDDITEELILRALMYELGR